MVGLISIVVPVYNIEQYLPKCLDTIARQTYRNLEIILVDDCSTDGSGIICDEFAAVDSRAVVFHHRQRKLAGATRNTGQAAAHGEFIMFVDGDDYLHLDTVKLLYEAINLDGGYDMVLFNHIVTYEKNEDIETARPGECEPLSQDDLMGNFYVWTSVWGKLFRRDVIKDHWSYDYERSQDVDYTFRAFLRINNALWVKKTLYFYVQREGSAIHKPESLLVGTKCSVQVLYDNLLSLPKDKLKYQHILLGKLYERMIALIGMTWETSERREIITRCRRYEKDVHKRFWKDEHFGVRQRMALYVNVRYPYAVRFLKKITGKRLSWPRWNT